LHRLHRLSSQVPDQETPELAHSPVASLRPYRATARLGPLLPTACTRGTAPVSKERLSPVPRTPAPRPTGFGLHPVQRARSKMPRRHFLKVGSGQNDGSASA